MSQLPSQPTQPSENSIPMEYNPHSGVTFRNTPVSDVLEIAGKGYSEDSHTVDPQPSTLSVKAREKRRNSKGENSIVQTFQASSGILAYIVTGHF